MSDASTQSLVKGLKYQSYKVIYSLIKKCVECEYPQIYVAIERFDDVAILDDDETFKIGQAKYYGNDFSINSEEIKKAIVNFFNNYLKFITDKTFSFEFFTCANFHSENSTTIITKDEIQTLKDNDKCFLEVLATNEHRNIKFADTVISVIGKIINPPKKPNKYDDYILDFLDRITWNFGAEKLEDVETKTIDLIKRHRKYNHEFEGKEKFIFDSLVQEIEMKSLKSHSLSSFINYKDVDDKFYKLKSNDYKILDDASEHYSTLHTEDIRNIEQKIYDISEIKNERFINIININITRGKSDLSKKPPNIANTLKYRVYEACQEHLELILSQETIKTKVNIDNIINNLSDKAYERIMDRSEDHLYPLHSHDIIKNTVLILFNECFLDFRTMEKKNELG